MSKVYYITTKEGKFLFNYSKGPGWVIPKEWIETTEKALHFENKYHAEALAYAANFTYDKGRLFVVDLEGKKIRPSIKQFASLLTEQEMHKLLYSKTRSVLYDRISLLWYLNSYKTFDNEPYIVCNGEQFVIGSEDSKMKGYGGRSHLIIKNDGREIETTNLWSQGELSETLKKIIPNNTVAIENPLKYAKPFISILQ